MNNNIREVVLLDFDGTITERDTVIPFVRECKRIRQLVMRLLAVVVADPRRCIRCDRDFIKEEIVARSLAGLKFEFAEKAAIRHSEKVIRDNMRPMIVDLMRKQRERGRELVIVSASFGLYLRQIASVLDVKEVLATELQVDNSILTGRLSTGNCRSSEKANRVLGWLAENPTAVIVAAYGNSNDDLPMLALAQVSYLVSAYGVKEVASSIDY